MSYFEMSLRVFFASEEADVTPQVTVVADQNKLAETDWNKVIEDLLAVANGQIKNAPLENVREMTREEIDAFRADEDKE